MTLIYKSREKSLVSNYRPVSLLASFPGSPCARTKIKGKVTESWAGPGNEAMSLLCITSKALERLIYDHLSKFILSHGIISSQFGYLKYRSTTQLLIFLDNVHHILNGNDTYDVIYHIVDARNAFNSVNRGAFNLKAVWYLAEKAFLHCSV